MWGEELVAVSDVHHVFECYITGQKNKNGVKVVDHYHSLTLSLSLPCPFFESVVDIICTCIVHVERCTCRCRYRCTDVDTCRMVYMYMYSANPITSHVASYNSQLSPANRLHLNSELPNVHYSYLSLISLLIFLYTSTCTFMSFFF